MAGNNNPYFAGMPQNKRSDYDPSPIGSVDLLPANGLLWNKGDGSVWLRAGEKQPAASYPAANALCPNLRLVGNPVILPSSTTITGSAMNSTGSVVYATGSATTVLVSTDYGATFTAVNHNAGGTVIDVVWDATNGLFITSGNTAVLQYVSTSPTGATFTARTGATLVGCTADTMRLCTYAGTTIAAAAGGTVAVGSSTNGTAWTARTLSQAVSTTVVVMHNGTNKFFVGGGGSTAANNSADGITWASQTMLANSNTAAYAGGLGLFVIITSSAGATYVSTTGATGSWSLYLNGFSYYGSSVSTSQIAAVLGNLSFSDGSFHFMDARNSSDWISTADFRTFTRKGLSAPPVSGRITVSGTNMVVAPYGSQLGMYTTNATTADCIGLPTNAINTVASGSAYYVRIK